MKYLLKLDLTWGLLGNTQFLYFFRPLEELKYLHTFTRDGSRTVSRPRYRCGAQTRLYLSEISRGPEYVQQSGFISQGPLHGEAAYAEHVKGPRH